jgi:alpha-amylase
MVKFKEQGLERFLVYDGHNRTCGLDHFLPLQLTPDDYAAGRFQEMGDFVQGVYEVEAAQPGGQAAMVRLVREGRAGESQIWLEKTIHVSDQPGLRLAYRLEHRGGEPLKAFFGCELNLTLYSDQDSGRYLYAPEYARGREVYENGREDGITRFELINQGDGLNAILLVNQPATAFFFPLMTVSLSEEGFEKTYQGTSLLLAWPLDMSAGRQAEFSLELRLETVD